MEKNRDIKCLKELGKRITYLRNMRGFTQLDLGLEAGLSKNYICDVELGRRNPTVLSLKKIANALRISLSDLLKGV